MNEILNTISEDGTSYEIVIQMYDGEIDEEGKEFLKYACQLFTGDELRSRLFMNQ
jgi:hypothetical protein